MSIHDLRHLPHMTDRYVVANKKAIKKKPTAKGVEFTFEDNTKYVINYTGREKEKFINGSGSQLTLI